ncbi:sporulation protein [Microbispora sp. NBC_01389]|uniref:sporulation protein n=1 Tax=Microbispora sp. NBC_01389 TaxID=2903584 RepID=UPI00324490E6
MSTPRSSIVSDHPPQPSSACSAADSSPQISSTYFIGPPLPSLPSCPYDERDGPERTRPFYQEIDYHAGPEWRRYFNELELTFIAGPHSMDVILEADKRGGFLTSGHDVYNRFQVGTATTPVRWSSRRATARPRWPATAAGSDPPAGQPGWPAGWWSWRRSCRSSCRWIRR